MNINPLTQGQRDAMIARLAEGLGPRAARTMYDSLSDGFLRTVWADLYHEPVPNTVPITFPAQQSVPLAPEIRINFAPLPPVGEHMDSSACRRVTGPGKQLEAA